MSANADTFMVRLPEDVRDQLNAIARQTQRSPATIINEAVANYLRDHAQFAHELDDALANAKSGIGHSADQVFRWMDDWAAGQKHPIPEPDVLPRK